MEGWDKILCDKHMHPDVYHLSEFIPMPNGEYMLISIFPTARIRINIVVIVHLWLETIIGESINKTKVGVLQMMQNNFTVLYCQLPTLLFQQLIRESRHAHVHCLQKDSHCYWKDVHWHWKDKRCYRKDIHWNAR